MSHQLANYWEAFSEVVPADHFVVKLLLSMALAALIGLERQVSGKPAGIRTHVLVAVGSTLFMMTSLLQYAEHVGEGGMADPNRVLSTIITGVGFLGAGTIMQAKGSVHGLTTAASIWVVAAIGAAVGAGQYTYAVGTTVTVVFVLMVLGRIRGPRANADD